MSMGSDGLVGDLAGLEAIVLGTSASSAGARERCGDRRALALGLGRTPYGGRGMKHGHGRRVVSAGWRFQCFAFAGLQLSASRWGGGVMMWRMDGGCRCEGGEATDS